MTLQPIEPTAATPASRPRYYTGQQTASAVGLSWQRFRKVRADWTRDRDFPAELNEPGEAVRYLADAVDRWVERRSRRVQPVRAQAPTRPAPEGQRAGRAGRSALRALKGAAPC